jgi:hypothetical protein
LRLSVGIEHIDDIKNDLIDAFAAVKVKQETPQSSIKTVEATLN